MKTQWQNEQRRNEPAPYASRLKLRGLELHVHRHTYYAPTVWLLSCHQIGVEHNELGDGISLESAQQIAIARAMSIVEGLRADLQEVTAPKRAGVPKVSVKK